MQETLILKNKVIEFPEIDSNSLSNTSGFEERLERFNYRYNADLKALNSARWEQGAFKKFKQLAVDLAFPNLINKKNIQNIFNAQTYSLRDAQSELMKLNSDLKQFRVDNLKLYEDDGSGKKLLDQLIDNFNESIIKNPDLQVNISQVPWFKQAYNKIAARPVIEDINGTIKNFTRNLSEYKIKETTNPKDWFLNIGIPLKNVEIDISTSRNKTICKVDYGDMLICQTISVYDAVSFLRLINTKSANRRFSINDKMSGYTFLFPKYVKKRLHPFVSKSASWNGYDTGNTCFGDLKDQILVNIASGKLNTAKMFLNRWASFYPVNSVNPLVKYDDWLFGRPLNRKFKETHTLFVNNTTCKTAVGSSTEAKQDFIERFCSNCDYIQECSVNKKWTQENIPLLADEYKEIKELARYIVEQYPTTGKYLYPLERDFIIINGKSIPLKIIDMLTLKYKSIIQDFKEPLSYDDPSHLTYRVKLQKLFNLYELDVSTLKEYDGLYSLDEMYSKSFNVYMFVDYFKYAENAYYNSIAIKTGIDCNQTLKRIRSTDITRQRMNNVSNDNPNKDIWTYIHAISYPDNPFND